MNIMDNINDYPKRICELIESNKTDYGNRIITIDTIRDTVIISKRALYHVIRNNECLKINQDLLTHVEHNLEKCDYLINPKVL